MAFMRRSRSIASQSRQMRQLRMIASTVGVNSLNERNGKRNRLQIKWWPMGGITLWLSNNAYFIQGDQIGRIFDFERLFTLRSFLNVKSFSFSFSF
jgi:hypothetical protein